MKIINKKPIPEQTCKHCGSKVAITYKDLKYSGWSLAKTDWRCPLCKTTQNVCFMSMEELKEKLTPKWVKAEVKELPKESMARKIVERFEEIQENLIRNK